MAVAAACAVAAPGVAAAQPALPIPSDPQVVPGYEALAALAPSLLDAAAVDAANPQNELLARAKQLLDTAPLSPDAKRILT